MMRKGGGADGERALPLPFQGKWRSRGGGDERPLLTFLPPPPLLLLLLLPPPPPATRTPSDPSSVQPCPDNSVSPAGSTKLADCVAVAGYYGQPPVICPAVPRPHPPLPVPVLAPHPGGGERGRLRRACVRAHSAGVRPPCCPHCELTPRRRPPKTRDGFGPPAATILGIV